MPEPGRRIGSALILVLLFGLSPVAAPGASAEGAADPYLVDGIRVDATAANAALAREQALAAGQRQALEALLRRLTLRTEQGRLPALEEGAIAELVAQLRVLSEKTSGVRYIAELSYRFKPDAVRALLRERGIDFVDAPGPTLLVLAVFEGRDGPVLWDEPNPWRSAWQGLDLRRGLVQFVQPLGDLTDFGLIDAIQAVDHDAEALAAIAGRYGAAQVLVVTALARPAAELPEVTVEVSAVRVDLQAREVIPVGAFAGARGPEGSDLYIRTAAALADEIEERWKHNNLVLSGPEARLQVRAPFADFAQWLNLRRRLEAVGLVRDSRVLRLRRRQADLELSYVGDVGRLAAALEQHGLLLSQEASATTPSPLFGQPSQPSWTLQMGAAPGAAGGTPVKQ